MKYHHTFIKHSSLIVPVFILLILLVTGCKTVLIRYNPPATSDQQPQSLDLTCSRCGEFIFQEDSEESFQKNTPEYLAEKATLEEFNAIVQGNIFLIALRKVGKQYAGTCLAKTLLKLLRCLPLKPVSSYYANNQYDVRTILILDKLKNLLDYLAQAVQDLDADQSEKLRSFINHHILGTVRFNNALLSAVNLAHTDVIDIILPRMLAIFGSERYVAILCEPFPKGPDKANTMLYRAVLGGGPNVKLMISCLIEHLSVVTNASSNANTSSSLVNIRTHFLNQLVEYEPGKLQTALHLAVLNCNVDGVEYLLELGADPNIESSRETSLDLAFKYANPHIIKTLLSYHAKPELRVCPHTGNPILFMDTILNRVLECAKRLSCSSQAKFDILVIDSSESLRALLDTSTFYDDKDLVSRLEMLKSLLSRNQNYKPLMDWLTVYDSITQYLGPIIFTLHSAQSSQKIRTYLSPIMALSPDTFCSQKTAESNTSTGSNQPQTFSTAVVF